MQRIPRWRDDLACERIATAPRLGQEGRNQVSAIRVVRQSGRVAVVDDQGAINEHCARFLEGVKIRGLSRCTVEAYAHDLALVHRWLFASGQTLAELGAEDVHRFLAWERGRASHPRSINRRLHTLRLFYRFVVGNDLLLAEALRAIPAKAALLDGELVSLDERGMSSFQRLQDALGGAPAGKARLVYFVFDLLYLDGVDLRGGGLVERKALLAELLAGIPSPFASTIRLSDHVIGQGPAFFAQAARMGLEGIVSKQRNAPYRSGRSRSWLKMKCSQRQELVVVGFTDPKGSRTLLGALLLATYSGGALVYRGRVGTGFSERSLRDLHRRLVPLCDRQPVLMHPPTGPEARGVHWVKPELVAEVTFSGFTRDGLLRHAIFLGLREDKSASDVVLESRSRQVFQHSDSPANPAPHSDSPANPVPPGCPRTPD